MGTGRKRGCWGARRGCSDPESQILRVVAAGRVGCPAAHRCDMPGARVQMQCPWSAQMSQGPVTVTVLLWPQESLPTLLCFSPCGRVLLVSEAGAGLACPRTTTPLCWWAPAQLSSHRAGAAGWGRGLGSRMTQAPPHATCSLALIHVNPSSSLSLCCLREERAIILAHPQVPATGRVGPS